MYLQLHVHLHVDKLQWVIQLHFPIMNILHESQLISYNGETRKCLKSESFWDTDLTIIFLVGEEYALLLCD